jgi:hypothetical protein
MIMRRCVRFLDVLVRQGCTGTGSFRVYTVDQPGKIVQLHTASTCDYLMLQHTAFMQYGRGSTITAHTSDSIDRLAWSWSSIFAHYIRVWTTVEGRAGNPGKYLAFVNSVPDFLLLQKENIAIGAP